jgi:hypothetical protein
MNKQTNRRTDSETLKLKDIYKWTGRLTESQTREQAGRQTDTKTDIREIRQRDFQINIHR